MKLLNEKGCLKSELKGIILNIRPLTYVVFDKVDALRLTGLNLKTDLDRTKNYVPETDPKGKGKEGEKWRNRSLIEMIKDTVYLG